MSGNYLFGMPVVINTTIPPNEIHLISVVEDRGRRIVRRVIKADPDPSPRLQPDKEGGK